MEKLPKGGLIGRTVEAYLWIREKQISLHAAYAGYFIILAAFPALLMLLSLLRFAGLQVEVLVDMMGEVLPPALMETVLRNVLVNAVRYSPENERICVKLYKELQKISCEDCQAISGSSAAASGPKDTALVIMEIENTGVHIEETELSRVFDAFYRADSSRNRKSGGSGLGLYIVGQILEQHGAGYELRNTDNGVLFRMKLPLENMTFTG